MRASLTFSLPDEGEEFETAAHGVGYRAVLHELDQFLRSEVKYGEDEAKGQHYQAIRDKLWALVRDEGLNLE